MTWCRSRVEQVAEFERMLRQAMPEGTFMFGCKEFHQDGVPHYHAVLGFLHDVFWEDAVSKFRLRRDDGVVDTRSVHIIKPFRKETVEQFLFRTIRYCAKNDNQFLFGKRFTEQDLQSQSGSVWRVRQCEECGGTVERELRVICGCCLADGVPVSEVSASLWSFSLRLSCSLEMVFSFNR